MRTKLLTGGGIAALAAAAALAGCARPGPSASAAPPTTTAPVPPTGSTSAQTTPQPQPTPQTQVPSQAQAQSQSQAQPMGPAEIKALYHAPHRENGVVLSGAHAGAHWTKWTKPDGTMELSAAHGLFADSGKYVVKGDQVCATWSHIDKGKQNCMHLLKDGANDYITVQADGSQGSRFSVTSP